MAIDWRPNQIDDDGYMRWDLPASAWSGCEYGEDSIKITLYEGEWSAMTEFDQCAHRQLDENEVASVRREFGLDRYI
jgi:hypothetical protein